MFVHGAAEDGRVRQPQLASLSDEFTVVAWDEPVAVAPPPRSSISRFRAVRRRAARRVRRAARSDLPAVRPHSLRTQLDVMAEADQRDLLPRTPCRPC